MSGYIGDPDAEATHALILAENAIHHAASQLNGPSRSNCVECDRQIDPQRVHLLTKLMIKCIRCIPCQQVHESRRNAQPRMLDRIL